MNNLRKNWKDNGTPFYFKLEYEGNVIRFSEDKCKYFDSIIFDTSTGVTLMDLLVDIQFVDRMLQRCTDRTFILSIKYLLWRFVSLINQSVVNHVSKSSNNS